MSSRDYLGGFWKSFHLLNIPDWARPGPFWNIQEYLGILGIPGYSRNLGESQDSWRYSQNCGIVQQVGESPNLFAYSKSGNLLEIFGNRGIVQQDRRSWHYSEKSKYLWQILNFEKI